ncbi:PspA/IM30 family protein [Arenicella xantha]|uniref:Phage shock protein A (PspA) family protein n=1 Tax=Arenicella xantha TaxID=644221 RepID=A0A395JEN0_9GAMM|nr:PspA/IM30 family protein [Arenicella xantha]RBP47063.1 phage shock protein A (PspA) family protein [Arenicella xantha]
MKLIKRLSTTISATLDSAVGQLENHDAIVEATIKQTRQSVAKTKARINTLQQQLNAYERQLTEAREQYSLWTERAAKLAETDQAKALQCVARRNQYEAEVGRLNYAAGQQRELIRDVSHNLSKLQSKLDEMTHKHNLMRSRQTVADVNRAVAHVRNDESISETFERWESVVLEHEFAVSDACSRDALDVELTRVEDEADLLMQLKLIQAESATNQPEKTHE